MVSNQSVRRSPAAFAGLLGGLAVLTLTSGCQLLTRPAPAAAPVAPPPAPAPTVVAATAPPPNAIEIAIAKAASEPQTVVTQTATAPAPEVKPTAPLSYTVKRGDTLWGISNMFLKDPWLWPEIWHVNPAVQNPHLIYPGDVLLWPMASVVSRRSP